MRPLDLNTNFQEAQGTKVHIDDTMGCMRQNPKSRKCSRTNDLASTEKQSKTIHKKTKHIKIQEYKRNGENPQI